MGASAAELVVGQSHVREDMVLANHDLPIIPVLISVLCKTQVDQRSPVLHELSRLHMCEHDFANLSILNWRLLSTNFSSMLSLSSKNVVVNFVFHRLAKCLCPVSRRQEGTTTEELA